MNRLARQPSMRAVVRAAAVVLGLSLCACATQSPARRELPAPDLGPLHEEWAAFPAAEEPARPEPGPEIAAAATSLVGLSKLVNVSREVPDDCTGLVRVAYYAAGVDLTAGGTRRGENGVGAIWRLAEAAGATHLETPAPGDLVFFVETYDRNRDGKRNDGRTHIGVVESVDAEGTVYFVHRATKGVTRSQLNREQPGRPWNSVLRPAKGKHRAYDTGELFAGFARPAALLAVAPTAPRAVVVREVEPAQQRLARRSKSRRPGP